MKNLSHFAKIIISSALPSLFALSAFAYVEEIPSAQNIIETANQFFNASLYDKAIPLYEDLLREKNFIDFPDEENIRADILLRLAQSHFFNGNPTKVIFLLKSPKGKLNFDQLFLLGVTYNNLGQHEAAITTLNECLPHLLKIDQIHFELGMAYFFLNNFEQSLNHFSSCLGNNSSTISFLAQLYIAKINLAKKNFAEAEKILDSLDSDMLKDATFRFELAYLKGEVAFQLDDYPKAANYFERALPQKNQENADWYWDTLHRLGWCYFKIADDPFKSRSFQLEYFEKAEKYLKKLLYHRTEERIYLTLGQYYLTRANRLQEPEAYENAEKILSKNDIFISREAQTHMLLLRAQAGSSYSLRDQFYRQLTQDLHKGSHFYSMGWYLQGLNHYEEGLAQIKTDQNGGRKAFERAARSLRKAAELLRSDDPAQAGTALKYATQALYKIGDQENIASAFSLLNTLLHQDDDLLTKMEDPDEIYFLQGLFALRLFELDEGAIFAGIAESTLKSGIAKYPEGKFIDAMLNLIGTLFYKQKKYAEAEQIYANLIKEHPNSSLAAESLFWAAHCAECQGSDPSKIQEYRRQVFDNFPNSQFAPEAYFSFYSYRDYLQGDRASIKHLQAFSKRYPKTPLLMNVYYLLGLDSKRDRQTPEGKWLCKKNLKAAIDAFQEVESSFENLYSERLIPEGDLKYYITIRYRATLERALTNLAIAEESQGAKRQIYLEYAEEVFKEICEDFENPKHPFIQILASIEKEAHIQEESAYWLAQTYVKNQQDNSAEKVLSKMLEKYRTAKITRGYFLSRVWYEQGLIAIRQNEFSIALQCFSHAEDAAKGKVLNADQKIDLWIQQSLCYRHLNQLDQAILILSKAVNDDAISGLRLKAMYLRAEIYELQERFELVKKQLEAISKKGGEWALKAKTKLETLYEYQ